MWQDAEVWPELLREVWPEVEVWHGADEVWQDAEIILWPELSREVWREAEAAAAAPVLY